MNVRLLDPGLLTHIFDQGFLNFLQKTEELLKNLLDKAIKTRYEMKNRPIARITLSILLLKSFVIWILFMNLYHFYRFVLLVKW